MTEQLSHSLPRRTLDAARWCECPPACLPAAAPVRRLCPVHTMQPRGLHYLGAAARPRPRPRPRLRQNGAAPVGDCRVLQVTHNTRLCCSVRVLVCADVVVCLPLPFPIAIHPIVHPILASVHPARARFHLHRSSIPRALHVLHACHARVLCLHAQWPRSRGGGRSQVARARRCSCPARYSSSSGATL